MGILFAFLCGMIWGGIGVRSWARLVNGHHGWPIEKMDNEGEVIILIAAATTGPFFSLIFRPSGRKHG